MNFNQGTRIRTTFDTELQNLRKQPECPTHDKPTKDLFSKSIPGCLFYKLPVCEPGNYELVVWIGDKSEDMGIKKCTDVYFNDLKITSATFDGGKEDNGCIMNELVVLFKVQKSQIFLLGFNEPVDIKLGEINLKFCFDNCKNDANVLQIASIHMVFHPRRLDACLRNSMIRKPIIVSEKILSLICY